MIDIGGMFINYQVSHTDVANIKKLAPFLESKKDDLTDYHYAKLMDNSETSRFFKNGRVMEKSKFAFMDWLSDFLSGDLSESSIAKIETLGAIHSKLGLPESVINITLSNVRTFLSEKILSIYAEEPGKAVQAISSVNKILDLNLDVMTRSCHEAELESHFLSQKLDSAIIRLARWFVTGLNIAMVFGLLVIGLLSLGLWIMDINHFLSMEGSLEHGAIGMLGSLLILWVVIELLDTQIGHIRGRAFAIKVFVSVALVAELRKTLISSIEHESWEERAIVAGSVLILGFVYWLISRDDPPDRA